MKRIIFAIVMVCCLFFTNKVYAHENEDTYTNSNNVQISSEKYNLFLEIGLSEEEIDDMTLETYNTYSDMDLVEIDKVVTIYFKDTTYNGYKYSETITEEISEYEYENEIDSSNQLTRASSSYETTYKKLEVTSSSISTTYPNKRAVSAVLTWKKLPSVRSYDIFAARTTSGEIAISSFSGTMVSTETSYDSACVYNGTKNYTTTYNSSSSSWNLYQNGTVGYTGIGFTGKLKNNSGICYSDLGPLYSEATGYYSTLTFQSTTGTTVYISYQHASTSVSYSSVYQAYTYSSSGLGNVILFSSSTLKSSYDGMGGISLTL